MRIDEILNVCLVFVLPSLPLLLLLLLVELAPTCVEQTRISHVNAFALCEPCNYFGDITGRAIIVRDEVCAGHLDQIDVN
jgi:hypothetical protein